MQVFFKDYGSAMISAVVGILIIPLIFITIGAGLKVENEETGETTRVSILKSHRMVLNKNSYNINDGSDLKLVLKNNYFTLKKNSTAFSSTTKIVNYLTARDCLEIKGDVDEWETSDFNTKKLGLTEINITAKNNTSKEVSKAKIYVKIVA